MPTIDVSMLSGAANLPKDLHQFQDGDKLAKRTVFARTKVRRYMRAGPCASPEFDAKAIRELDLLIKESKALSKEIGAENRRAQRCAAKSGSRTRPIL